MSYDTTTHATEHFSYAEWDPRNVSTADQRAQYHRHANGVLEPMRAHFGRPFSLTPEGGVRSHAEQKAIWDHALAQNGGNVEATLLHVAHPGSSQHEVGDASDIYEPSSARRAEMVAYLVTNPNVGGIGLYPWGVHVDSRPRNGGPIARW